MYGVRSLTSGRSGPLSELDSHATILKPSESAPSEIVSIFGAIMAMEDTDSWMNKLKFVGRTLSFCLGPGNLWRFPRQAFFFGGGTYFYMYVIYFWLFGVSMFIFELGQSQYYSRGFAKLYSFCPIMEGIPLSMVLHCVISGALYTMINIYSFLYFFSSFYKTMPHSECTEVAKKYNCTTNVTSYTNSSEYFYFYYHVVEATDIQPDKILNWRNLGILTLISVLTCVMILFAVIKFSWVSITTFSVMFLILLYTTVATFTLNGTDSSLLKLFIPNMNSLGALTTWVYSFEQFLVSLGLGSGPLTTFWSFSKMRLLSYKDCVIMCLAVLICTILSGVMFFNSTGPATANSTIKYEHYFAEHHYENIHSHIFVTQGLNALSSGINNFTVAIFYFLLIFSCFFTVLEYLQLLLLYLNSFEIIRKFKRTNVIVVTSLAFFSLMSLSATQTGYALMMSIDKIFIGTSVIFIVFCEMLTMCYFFGMRNLCDDIEFVLGFVPNYYFQVIWLSMPILLFLAFIFSLYLKITSVSGLHDKVTIIFLIGTTMMPILVVAGMKIYKAAKKKNFKMLFTPPPPEENAMSTSDRSSRHQPKRSH